MRARDVVGIEHDVDAANVRWPVPSLARRAYGPVPNPAVLTGTRSAAVPGGYVEAFAAVQHALHAGDSYETKLTYRERVISELDPVEAYLRLRRLSPSPYAGFLQHRGAWLLSSSPERYATLDRHRTIETKPIERTTPRGATTEQSATACLSGRGWKFRAANLMIVDLLRNGLGMVCTPGTVEVPVP